MQGNGRAVPGHSKILGQWGTVNTPHLFKTAKVFMKCLAVALMILFGAVLQTIAETPPRVADPKIKQAQLDFDKAEAAAAETYRNTMRDARKLLLASVIDQLKRATQAGDFDKAASFNELKKYIEAEIANPHDMRALSKVVDLLALSDTNRNAVAGSWVLKDGVLKCVDSIKNCRFQFPYHPPQEYDYCIVFSRDQGSDCVCAIPAVGNHQFAWIMGGWVNTILGFEHIGGVTAKNNATAIQVPSALTTGSRYESIIKVRKTGVEAFLNGKLISRWKTDFSDMSPGDWSLNDPQAIGLGCYTSPTTIFKAEITEITGHGTVMINSTTGGALISTTPPDTSGLFNAPGVASPRPATLPTSAPTEKKEARRVWPSRSGY